ncbi:MAG: outer membrane beta-barrel domain-containing protein [Gammaproteobacteria bacterium]|nr:MAG: outer membrane beta-barrel domain-containing protein [Gammaproteobacteria bacterium]
MENRLQCVLLVGLLAGGLALSAPNDEQRPSAAEEVITPPKRTEIDLANIDAWDVEIGIEYGMMNVEDFGTNPILSGYLAYHVSEDFFIQAGYGQTDTEPTSFERLSGATLLTDDQRQLQYYDLTVGVNLLPGEGFVWDKWAFNSSFYLIGGVGSTNFADDNRFTVTWGAGYRIVLRDWLAIKFEFRDHFYDIDLLGENKTSHNLSYRIGISGFF